MAADNQFSLLSQRRFGPLFATQFLGAFNDNIFRNALIILITFQAANQLGVNTETLINICFGLFILPFFLISATAGQLADKFEKSRLIRGVKILEIVIMTTAFIGFYTGNIMLLIVLLFLMGAQSALFGPLKYGILPQHVSERELVGANGMIESGTFLAILLGSIIGNALMGFRIEVVAVTVILLAAAGYLASRGIPEAKPVAPDLKINWNLFTEIGRNIAFTRTNRTVFLSILGISWFWFLGSVYLAQLPIYSKEVLSGDKDVFTWMLTLFMIGIGIGSLSCERLSGRTVELGLVPLGSIGLTLFGIDLFFAMPAPIQHETLLSPGEFFALDGSWRVAADIVLVGVFGGFYSVPLTALIQQRSERSHLSRIIAGSNIINAFFMVMASVVAILLLNAGLSIPQLFLVMALMNAAVAIYIYTLVPEFLLRFLVWILVHLIYRVRKEGLQHIPDNGPVVLVCNHVSYLDALVIAGCVRRPTRFVMYHKIYHLPVLNFLFRTVGTVPIASAKEDPELLEQAFARISDYLNDDEVVCIFPEGGLTKDGEIAYFRPGIERIIEANPVPVVPMALRNFWDSAFSRQPGGLKRLPGRIWARISLAVGEPVAPDQISAGLLQEKVSELRGEWK